MTQPCLASIDVSAEAGGVDAGALMARDCVLLASGLPSLAVTRLKRMLQRLCFHVRVAGSAEQALQMVANAEPALLMAAAGAAERLFWRLRTRPAMTQADAATGGDDRQQVACIAILTAGAADEVLRMMMAGADECLVWPFDTALLARRLGHLAAFA